MPTQDPVRTRQRGELAKHYATEELDEHEHLADDDGASMSSNLTRDSSGDETAEVELQWCLWAQRSAATVLDSGSDNVPSSKTLTRIQHLLR